MVGTSSKIQNAALLELHRAHKKLQSKRLHSLHLFFGLFTMANFEDNQMIPIHPSRIQAYILDDLENSSAEDFQGDNYGRCKKCGGEGAIGARCSNCFMENGSYYQRRDSMEIKDPTRGLDTNLEVKLETSIEDVDLQGSNMSLSEQVKGNKEKEEKANNQTEQDFTLPNLPQNLLFKGSQKRSKSPQRKRRKSSQE